MTTDNREAPHAAADVLEALATAGALHRELEQSHKVAARLRRELDEARRGLAAARDRLDANGVIPDRYDETVRERDEARQRLAWETSMHSATAEALDKSWGRATGELRAELLAAEDRYRRLAGDMEALAVYWTQTIFYLSPVAKEATGQCVRDLRAALSASVITTAPEGPSSPPRPLQTDVPGPIAAPDTPAPEAAQGESRLPIGEIWHSIAGDPSPPMMTAEFMARLNTVPLANPTSEGRPVSWAEAVRVAEQVLLDAERRRAELAEREAAATPEGERPSDVRCPTCDSYVARPMPATPEGERAGVELLEDEDGAPFPEEVQEAHRYAVNDLVDARDAALREAERLRAALAWLVRLHDGPRDHNYEFEKPRAWAAAAYLLSTPDTPEAAK